MRRVAAVALVTLSLVIVQQAGVALPGYGETRQVSGPRPLPGHDTARAAPVRLDAETESAWEAYAGMVAAATAVCFPSSAPQPERLRLVGDPISQKVRYLSFTAGDPGRLQAIRVTFQSLPVPYDTWNGVSMWVQEPETYCENAGVVSPPCPAAHPANEFTGATLGCSPWFGDFHSLGMIHVYHEGIIPSATYVVQVVDSTCDPGQESHYSDPLWMTMSLWGDVVGNCTTCPCGPPNGTVSIPTDVTACLDKFKNFPNAVKKSRADIEPNSPDWLVNISDVTLVLDAFRGCPYPAAPDPPSHCPGGWTGPGGCS